MARARRSRGSVPALAAVLLVAAVGPVSACSYQPFDEDVTLEDCATGWNEGYWKDGEPPEVEEVYENRFGTTGRAFGFIAEQAAVVTDKTECTVFFNLGDRFISYRSVTREPELSAPVLGGWNQAEDVRPRYALERYGFTSWNACQEDDGTIALLEDRHCAPHNPAVRARPVEAEEEAKRRATLEVGLARLPPGKHAYWLGTRFAGALFWPYDEPEAPRADAQVDYTFDERVPLGILSILTYAKELGTTPSCFIPEAEADLCPDGSRVLGRVDTNDGETVLVVSLTGEPASAELREEILAALEPYEPA
jgi:hypothetical protein